MLLRYAFLVRGFVAIVGVAATRLAAGTHYDVSPLTEVAVAFAAGTWVFAPGSWEQLFWLTLLPQLVIWPAFTVLSGITAGAAALWLAPDADPSPSRDGAPADAPGSDEALSEPCSSSRRAPNRSDGCRPRSSRR